MYKTWKDIKEGDTIYYYDHGKIHEQKVHSIERGTKTYEYTWGTTRTISVDNYMIIKAGKGSEIKINEFYYDYDSYRWGGLTRFTSKDGLIDFIRKLNKHAQIKANKLKKRYDRYINCIEKYNNIIKET